MLSQFLADRTNHHSYAECCVRLSVVIWTLCIVAKWCVLEHRSRRLLTAYRKSHIGNWLVPKWMILIFV